MSDLELFGRIALAAALGFAVGWEREVRGQAAGCRTFSLVGAGSAAFTVLAVDAFPSTAEKLIAGVVTGVGFIGAGLILHTAGGAAKGITIAAGIWHAIHLTSFVVFVAGTVHGLTAGTDRHATLFQWACVLSAGLVLMMTLVRVWAPRRAAQV